MFRGSRTALLVPLSLLLLVGLLAGLATAPGGAQAVPENDTAGLDPSPNSTMAVDLRPDGDARWTVATEFDLASEDEREAFRDLAAAFERGETEPLGLEAFDRARARASQATGRTMALEDVELRSSPDARIANGTGRLVLSFTWTNFAVREEGTLQLGDAFNTTDGTWLPGLTANQRLLIRPPSGGGVIDANASPRGDGTLVWEGPRDLAAADLGATFTVRDRGPDRNLWWIVALIAGPGAAVVVLYAAARRGRVSDLTDAVPDPSPTADDATGDPATEPEEPGVAAAGPTAPAPDETEEDLDLLSDEERVERLLERNGGRMKQANIVSETGWSNAKVSQLLSAMEEDGRIDKLRIGRENLISFPDEDITGEE